MIKRMFILFTILLLFSCTYSTKEADQWVKENKGKTDIDIKGVWSSDEWGYAEFNQGYNYVNGKVGDYDFYGYINKRKIYMVSPRPKGRVYYTMILELINDNMLQGKYYDGNIEKNTEKARIIILKRVNPKNEGRTSYKTINDTLE